MMKAVKLAPIFLFLFFFPGSYSLRSDTPQVAIENGQARVRFKVRAVEEKKAERIVFAETHIEGPPGTDFDIKLQDRRFSLNAIFITDLVKSDHFNIRVGLDTKRLVGYSERNLPLYEVDEQQQTLEVKLDETLALLPFGAIEEGSAFKIEIEPGIVAASQSSGVRPLKIDIVKSSQSGILNVSARKIPHRFNIAASLRVNGKEIAIASSDCLLKQPCEIKLEPVSSGNDRYLPLAVSMNVEDYSRGCPAGGFAIGFDLYRAQPEGSGISAMIAKNWAGAGNFGESLTYNLNDLFPGDKKCELVFTLKLAKGEFEE
jgi:hypothetical protein